MKKSLDKRLMFLLWIVELKRKEAEVYIICIWSSLYCCFSEALRVAEPKPEARNNNRSLLRSEFFSFTWVLSSFFKFHAVNLAYYININLNTNNINLLNYITTTTSTSYYEWMLPSHQHHTIELYNIVCLVGYNSRL